jgi:hypothetical protein
MVDWDLAMRVTALLLSAGILSCALLNRCRGPTPVFVTNPVRLVPPVIELV